MQEAYGDEYHSVMEGLLRGYEAVEDKTDAVAIQSGSRQGDRGARAAEDVEPEGCAVPCSSRSAGSRARRNRESNRRNLEPDAIDAETIRLQGFDKVWEKASPVKSALCWGTDNISGQTVRELLGALREIPTLDEIKAAIVAYHKRTGKRPKCRPGVEFEELGRNCRAVDHVCRGHYGVSLSQLVVQALGGRNDGLVERTRELIRDYWVSRGIRLTRRYGVLPEIDMTTEALNQRLRKNHDTTIALEAEKILGPHLSLTEIRQGIRDFHQATGKRPKWDIEDRICGKKMRTLEAICRKYHGTTLYKEVRLVLGEANEG